MQPGLASKKTCGLGELVYYSLMKCDEKVIVTIIILSRDIIIIIVTFVIMIILSIIMIIILSIDIMIIIIIMT